MADLLVQKKISNKEMLKRTWKYISKEKKAFIISILLILLNVGLGVISPRVNGFFADYIIGDNVVLGNIILIALTALGIALFAQTFVFLESKSLSK